MVDNGIKSIREYIVIHACIYPGSWLPVVREFGDSMRIIGVGLAAPDLSGINYIDLCHVYFVTGTRACGVVIVLLTLYGQLSCHGLREGSRVLQASLNVRTCLFFIFA